MGGALNDLSRCFNRLNGRYSDEQPVDIGKSGDPEPTGKYYVKSAKRTQD